MKLQILLLAIFLALGVFAFAQDTTPPGTHRSPKEAGAVRPSKKHVRGNKAKAAPSDIGRGAEAAGHDIKTGHPIEAGKAIGEGTGRAAKDVAKGTDTEAHKAVHTTKRGVRKTKRKVTGVDRDRDRDSTSPPPPQR